MFNRLMERPKLLIGFIVGGVLVLAAGGALLWYLSQAGSEPPATPQFSTPPADLLLTPPPSLDDLTGQYPELAGLLGDESLDSVYKDFMIAYQEGGIDAARDLARERGILTDDDEIRITLVIDSAENTAAVVEELEQFGIVVEGSYEDQINIAVPVSFIEAVAQQQDPSALFQQLSQMEHIVRLRLPTMNRPDRSVSRAGVSGEGVAMIGADAWHQAGFTGQGVRVGVLDLGFDGYRQLLGSDLPSNVSARSFVRGEEPDESGEVHGTACAEIVHEVAPGATLFLAYYDGSDVSQGMAIEWLREQDVQIISHSAGSEQGPMDGSGDEAQMVDRLAAEGILWVNAAGNEAEQHYRGTFTDSDGDKLHEFPDGNEYMAIGPYLPFFQVTLNWDDWQVADQDYDLYIYDEQNSLIASSLNYQGGNAGDEPLEVIFYSGASRGETYFVAIKADRTTRPAVFDLYVYGGEIAFPVAEHSLSTPSDARGSLTVGAVQWYDEQLASYSSQGPSNDGRIKPEVTAPTGVSGSSYGQSGFDGTSASCPHVAGAAALVWSAFPNFTRDEVVAYLQTHVRDMGASGPDPSYGYGLVRLPAVSDMQPGPGVAATPPSFATLVPTPPAAGWVPTPGPAGSSGGGYARPPAPLGLLLCLISLMGIAGVFTIGGAALLIAATQRRARRGKPIYYETPADTEPEAPWGTLFGSEQSFILRAGVNTIGRVPGNSLTLADVKVSRQHAEIRCADGQVVLTDLGSSNGTFVDGQPINRPVVLQNGAQVRFGNTTFTYRVEGQPGAGPEAPPVWIRIGPAQHLVRPAGLTIGRSSSADVPIDDPQASRQHARIAWEGGRYIITDLGSSNGTYVNNQLVARQLLRPGDEIRIGQTRIQFEVRRQG